ncbi:carbohydrate kinase family protein [Paenibacillus gansuensis]|uniref:Carbohydrate kinase family protein n=1 Tax=Paenibacillus gansuensis TaxID=306542 RepID=A0ABW5PB31_9BACL
MCTDLKHDAVCIVGNANIDILMKSLDVIPEWGTEKIVDVYEERLGGCAANSAVVLSSLGRPTYIVATVGNDRHGKELRTTLQDAGINISGLRNGNQGTGMSLSLNRTDGERLFVTYPGAMFETTFDEVSDYLTRSTECKYLLLTGYFLLSPDIHARGILEKASDLGMTTFFDTGWPIYDWDQKTRDEILNLLPYVDYFLPNEMEACAIMNEKDPKEAARQLAAICRNGVVVKRGGGGSYFQDKTASIEIHGYEVTVKDTVGAGDSFNAGFIYGVSTGMDLAKCVELGNAVAATVISHENGFHVQWKNIEKLLVQSSTQMQLKGGIQI